MSACGRQADIGKPERQGPPGVRYVIAASVTAATAHPAPGPQAPAGVCTASRPKLAYRVSRREAGSQWLPTSAR